MVSSTITGELLSDRGMESDVRAGLFEPRPDVRTWIIRRAVEEAGVSPELGPSAFRDMQSFLHGAASHPGVILSPSKAVDEMWHGWMLRPGDLWRCFAEAGAFVDHTPNSDDGPNPAALTPAQTYQFLVDSGYSPDPAVWPLDSVADCEAHCNSDSRDPRTIRALGDCAGQKCYGSDCSSQLIALPGSPVGPIEHIG